MRIPSTITVPTGMPSVAYCERKEAETTPERLAMEMTDRSMPPVIMASMFARASRPYSGNCRPMEVKLRSVRNCVGQEDGDDARHAR